MFNYSIVNRLFPFFTKTEFLLDFAAPMFLLPLFVNVTFYLSLIMAVAMSNCFAVATAFAGLTPFEQACYTLSKSTRPDSERLEELFRVTWEYQMREYPEAATYSGYPGQNHRWTDLSLAAIERRKRELHAPLKTLATIRRENLKAAKQLNYDLFRRHCEIAVTDSLFPEEYFQITQLDGIHQGLAMIIHAMPKFTLKDYQDIIDRLQAVGVLVDQTITLLEKGLAAGISPPKITLRDVIS